MDRTTAADLSKSALTGGLIVSYPGSQMAFIEICMVFWIEAVTWCL